MSAPNPEKQPRQIFRKASLERLSNPEQLDSLFVVVTPKAWAALICLIAIALITILWTIFGSIPIKVEGKGLVMNEKGELFTVETKIGGTVKEIYVKPGDTVKKDDLIAVLFDPEEELKLAAAKIKVDNLTKDLERLKEEVSGEEKANTEAIERELTAKQFSIEQQERKVKAIEEEEGKEQTLVKEGLIGPNILLATQERLTNARIELETTRATIATLKYNLTKGYRTQEIKLKEHELFQANMDKEILETRKPYFYVYSPSEGRVLEVLVSVGNLVQPGTSIVWMEYVEQGTDIKTPPHIFYGYFPIEQGKRITIGAQVQITLSTVDPQEYGYLLGTVKEVSAFAVSKDSIIKLIHNRELVEFLTSGAKAVIQVVVKPEVDPLTGEYKWTSGKIPPVKITTGTVSTIQAITSRIRPIYYVLPIEGLKFEELSSK